MVKPLFKDSNNIKRYSFQLGSMFVNLYISHRDQRIKGTKYQYMKRVLLTILTFSTLSFAASAQDGIEIYLHGATDVDYSSGGVVQITTSTSNQITTDFDVWNNTGSSHDWVITRKRINEIASWSDELCWSTCYTAALMPSNPWTTPNSYTVADGTSGLLDTYITPDAANPGTVTYRYFVSTDGVHYSDSVDVEVTFVLDVAAISPEISVSVSPNPASEYITIKAGEGQQGTVRIVDVLGNVVLNESMTSNKKVNVSTFRNGIYFVIVQPDNGKAVNKKIVVRH